MELDIVILAAGKGTRMRSDTPKVMQPLAERPLLAHVLDTAAELNPSRIHVVFGHGGEAVRAAFRDRDLQWSEQTEQLGTGHAVLQAMPAIPDTARVLILCGDVPLVPVSVLNQLLEDTPGELGVLTAGLDDPTGYGRILRDSTGNVAGIVEQKDATAEQQAITEINSGIMVANAACLRRWLGSLGNQNAQGEYYLTDIVALAVSEGLAVSGTLAPQADLLLGINDRQQLAQTERRFQQRQAEAVLASGVSLIDPARFDLRGSLTAGRDVLIDVNVVLRGTVRLGDGVSIGANCFIEDSEIGPGTVIEPFSHIVGARTGQRCTIGPYARLRPGSDLADGVKVGNFVEIKQARIDAGSKVNHLTYIGDALIGPAVNVGAGTITCNYDGANKHQTVIGANAFIGSGAMLVAPVKIGAGATIGAGSTITRNAPDGVLTVARARQVSIDSWKRPQKQPK